MALDLALDEIDIDGLEDFALGTQREHRDPASFKIKQITLLGLTEKASSGLGSGSTDQEILKAFQLEILDTSEPKLLCMATDLDLSIIAEATTFESIAPGVLVINAIKLKQIISSLESEDYISFTPLEENKVLISTESVEWVVVCENAMEYPEIADPGNAQFEEVDRMAFADNLRKVGAACPRDSLRPGLIVIDINSDRIRASDGVRFHSVEMELPFDFQIPADAKDDLLKFLRLAVDDKIGIAEVDDHIMFKVDDDILIATAMVTEFIDMAPYMAEAAKNDKMLVLDKPTTLKALERVKVSVDKDTSQIRLLIKREGVKLEASNKLSETCTHELVTDWEHDDRVVPLNIDHLTDAINAHATPTITVAIGENDDVPVAILGQQHVVTILRQHRI